MQEPLPILEFSTSIEKRRSSYTKYKSVRLYGHLVGNYLRTTSKPESTEIYIVLYPYESETGNSKPEIVLAPDRLRNLIQSSPYRFYSGKPIYLESRPGGNEVLSVESGTDIPKSVDTVCVCAFG
jgi:hypothetical protein